MTESAQKLASEPDPLFTFQVLNGNFKVNASKRIGLVEVKAGDVNLYGLAKKVVKVCLGMDALALVSPLVSQGQTPGCIMTLLSA
jgi:hypothetical protein